jgi:hypothetical protein
MQDLQRLSLLKRVGAFGGMIGSGVMIGIPTCTTSTFSSAIFFTPFYFIN